MLYPIVDGIPELIAAREQTPLSRLERPQTGMIGSIGKAAA
jgi:uncharacterized protein YbaR (Trm112 family)